MIQNENEKQISIDFNYQLWVMLDHLRYVIYKARRKELAKYKITPEQAQILYNLGHMNSITLNKLVEYTQHQHHSISTLINRMENKGLVTKTKIPGKGKKLYISITEKGQELLGTMCRESFTGIFTCLSVDEKQEMITSMSKLLINSYKVLGNENTPLCINDLSRIMTLDSHNLP